MPDEHRLPPPPPFDAEAYLERFGWHPEPELIGFRDAATSREGVRRLGEATWAVAVDYLYEQAARRAMGASHDYDTARAEFYGGDSGPSPAPSAPSRSADVLAEFERRLAASQLNAQHPRNFGYFTPPISWPVISRVTSGGANDALRVPSLSRTTRLTSSRVVANTTHAAYRGGSDLPMTRMVLADSSG